MRQNKKNTQQHLFVSIAFALGCLLLYLFFPTTLFFDEVVKFTVFIFLLPIIFTAVILHKSWKIFFHTPTNLARQIVISVFIGIIFGGTLGILAGSTTFADSYAKSLESFAGHFGWFILYEALLMLPSIFFSVFFGYIFVTFILKEYTFAWIAGLMTTIALFVFDGSPIWFGLFPLFIILLLHKIRMGNIYTVTTSIFVALLIFDTFVIKSLI